MKVLKNAIRRVLESPELLVKWKQIMSRTSEKFRLASRKKAMNDLFDVFTQMSDKKKRSKD